MSTRVSDLATSDYIHIEQHGQFVHPSEEVAIHVLIFCLNANRHFGYFALLGHELGDIGQVINEFFVRIFNK